MLTKLNGKEVEYECEHSRDPEDSYITEAWWVATGKELTANELGELASQEGDTLYYEWQEHQAGAADAAYDAYKESQWD
jgi:hypothetical protein